jgi:glycosyltransferase involved in cell wall biosynthesis
MRILLVHTHPLDRLGGAELSLQSYVAAAPDGVTVDVVLPDEPVVLDDYEGVVLANLRPDGGPGEEAECRPARQWMERLKGYAGLVVRLEHDIHPCPYRDARCFEGEVAVRQDCKRRSPIRKTYERLYNLCDIIIFRSPMHRRVINQMIRINGPRQVDVNAPVDLNRFRSVTPFEERKHAALISGDPIRVAADAEALAAAQGYPVEFLDYLSVPHEQMPEVFNRYQAVVVAPVMLHASGRLAIEALACGCKVITNNRVGAMSWPDPLESSRRANEDFWKGIEHRPLHPNPRRFKVGIFKGKTQWKS